MKKNLALEKLRQGDPVFGYWLTGGSPLVAEAMAQLGFDFLLIDRQHGYWSFDATLQALQVISPTATMPFVRVRRNEPGLINQALDMGALGVIVPLVNSAEEAAAAVAPAKYPPVGSRSTGGSRLALYGSDYTRASADQFNFETLVAVMIETREGVEQAEAILSVPGVDAGFIGPSDLAFSLGVLPFQSQEHEAALQKVLQAGRNTGTPVGMPLATPALCRERASQGFTFLTCGGDMSSLLGDAKERRAALE